MPSNTSTAVLVVAHGSRSELSNQHFVNLVGVLRDRLPENPMLAHAFLEMAAPSISDGLDQLRTQGAGRISLLPYFLGPGRHVVEDIPAIIASYNQSYPDVEVSMMDFFGSMEDAIIPALLSIIANASTG